MSSEDVLPMPSPRRIEVFTTQRRRWSAEVKAEIIAASYATSVGEAAQQYGLAKTQIFTWRRDARRAGQAPEFAQVEVNDGVAACVGRAGVVEVQIGAAAVRIPPGADPRIVMTVLTALRSTR